MENRRMFARINVDLPIEFLNPLNGKKCEAKTVDISANGIGFITKESLPCNVLLQMWLVVPGQQKPIHVLGKIVWSKDLADSIQKRVGVHLNREKLVDLREVLLFKEQNEHK